MGHLAAMPTVKDFGARHAYGNEVLANAMRVFPPSSADTARFFGSVQALVADMQEFPGWYHDLSDSNEDLVEHYVTVTWILDAMKVAGFAGASGAGGKIAGGGFMGAAKSAEAGAGFKAVSGAAFQGSRQAAIKLATGGLATRAGIFVWIIGQTAYTVLQDEQATMRREIVRRYQEGRLPGALYQRAMGSDMPPPARYLFPL